ncbi:MAG TPA: hypothetical protein O0X99_01420, partial [Methanocorpusculum sp.]|nr:hypothetical protein [Methanocorpusculum sp.]
MIQDNCDWYILPESAITRIHKTLQSRGFDERLEKLVLAYISRVSGKSWDDKSVLNKIQNAIITQKNTYR